MWILCNKYGKKAGLLEAPWLRAAAKSQHLRPGVLHDVFTSSTNVLPFSFGPPRRLGVLSSVSELCTSNIRGTWRLIKGTLPSHPRFQVARAFAKIWLVHRFLYHRQVVARLRGLSGNLEFISESAEDSEQPLSTGVLSHRVIWMITWKLLSFAF